MSLQEGLKKVHAALFYSDRSAGWTDDDLFLDYVNLIYDSTVILLCVVFMFDTVLKSKRLT